VNVSLQRRQSGYCPNRLHHVRHVVLRSWLLLALPVLWGCGQSAPPATVEGTVRINGKSLDHCLITFLPESGQEVTGPHSTGVTDARGYYRLRLPDQREGASVGRHRVLVQDLSVSTGVCRRDHGRVDQEIEQTTPPAPTRRSRVPARYNSAEGTPLRRDVKPGRQVFDLELVRE